MAVRAFRNLTFILFLTLSVAALSSVVAPAVHADGSLGVGGGYGTSGDPDQPKDTGPRPIHATTTSSANSSSMTMVEVQGPANDSRGLGRHGKYWMMGEILIRSLIGRPGLVR